MKRFLFSLVIALVASTAFAYDYPPTIRQLLQQYADSKTSLVITTDEALRSNTSFSFTNQHTGTIRLVMQDYILFDDSRDGVIVISIVNIVTIQGD